MGCQALLDKPVHVEAATKTDAKRIVQREGKSKFPPTSQKAVLYLLPHHFLEPFEVIATSF